MNFGLNYRQKEICYMQLPSDYEQAQVSKRDVRRKLPAGGYICKIVDAKETQSRSGKPSIQLFLDIFEGEYKDYFAKEYANKIRFGNENPKWGCTEWKTMTNADNKTNPYFKGTLTAICESNPNAMIIHQGNLSVEAMKNCVVGVVFQEDHSVFNGKEIIKAKPYMFLNVQRIRKGEFTVPPPKLLTDEEKAQLYSQQGFAEEDSSNDSGLPF